MREDSRVTIRCLLFILFAGAVTACGAPGGSCGDMSLDGSYFDRESGLELFLRHDCQSGRVEGSLFDGREFHDLYSTSIYEDRFSFSSSEWRTEYPNLEIFDGGRTLVGSLSGRDPETRERISLATVFRARANSLSPSGGR